MLNTNNKKIIIIIIFSIFYSCDKKEYGKNENRSTPIHMSAELIQIDSIEFELDSLTAHLYNASQYIEKKNCYSFLSNTNDIVFYNYSNKEMISKTHINTDSPCSYEYINKDSILVANYKTNSIYIINEDGIIGNELKIDRNIKYYPFPLTKIAPIINSEDKVYLFGSICGEYPDENNENRKVVSIIDKSSLVTTTEVAYPEIYKENWGGLLFRWIYADYNPIQHMVVLSFPADHYIYTTDLGFCTTKKYYAGCSLINNTEYLEIPKTVPISSDESSKYFVETNSYSRIIYDKYDNVYYRIAELKTKYEGIPIWKKELVIIILDEQFNILGETYIGAIPSQYRGSVFVTKEGLHLPKKDVDENKIMFNIYKISKK